jgi:hypothetical protein
MHSTYGQWSEVASVVVLFALIEVMGILHACCFVHYLPCCQEDRSHRMIC